jgi:hypothetical protein
MDLLNEIFKVIQFIFENVKYKDPFIDGTKKDYVNSSINTLTGRNWENFILLVINSEIKKYDDFIIRIFESPEDKKEYLEFFCLLGLYFDNIYIFNNFESRNPEFLEALIKKVHSLTGERLNYFVTGYLFHCRYINILKEIKDIIFKEFENNNIKDNLRNRLVELLSDMAVKFEDYIDIVKKFEQTYSREDYNYAIRRLIYLKDVDNNKIFKYWKELINQIRNKTQEGVIDLKESKYLEIKSVSIFTKHAILEDLDKNNTDFIRECLTFDGDIFEQNDLDKFPDYFMIKDFLEKIEEFLNGDIQENLKTYINDLLTRICEVIPYFKYSYNIDIDFLSVIKPLYDQGRAEEAKFLAQHFIDYNPLSCKAIKEWLITIP